jgi:hypothetical protein
MIRTRAGASQMVERVTSTLARRSRERRAPASAACSRLDAGFAAFSAACTSRLRAIAQAAASATAMMIHAAISACGQRLAGCGVMARSGAGAPTHSMTIVPAVWRSTPSVRSGPTIASAGMANLRRPQKRSA